MDRFGKAVVKFRIPILIIGILLLIPSALGILSTRINYDMLMYLPDEIDTIKGQDILLDEFGKGAFSMVMVEGMEDKDVAALKEKIEQIDHVDSVIWYDTFADISIPKELLPDKLYDAFNTDDCTMMAVFLDSSTSADETIQAIDEIKSVAGKQVFVSGMSAMVTELKELCEREEPIYVGLAVIFSCIAMMLFLDSFLLPILFLVSIGIAIIWNLGSNVFLGEISYITKALAAVLQLAVTMDYSIFLWHSYSEELEIDSSNKKNAMAIAIGKTLTSVIGSSTTTVAGFIALCFMTFTLGLDLGLVMAKGVILGVIGCITVLPSLILLFDKAIRKTKHRPLMPKFDKFAHFVIDHYAIFLVLFVVILVPAVYGNNRTPTYYDLGSRLPADMDYVIATNKLSEDFDMGSTHMILADTNMDPKDVKAMLKEMEEVPGVQMALGLDSFVGSEIPEELLPEEAVEILKSDNYQLMLIGSEYKTATDEVNEQVTTLNNILKKYDPNGMLIGEAPCTKDLITITDHDFKVVNAISIVAIFVIIALTLRSLSLPFVLVMVIEFAIFINLGIPYYTNTVLPFIAPICISTIQLGATVDYAILMTTRYKRERYEGNSKKDAVCTALSTSLPSIVVSALGFFAATFGVSVYSDIDIIGSLCDLMARGAIISLCSVAFVLPSMYMLFDKIICKTSMGFVDKTRKNQK